MAKKKRRPPPKPQQKHKKATHLPKVGSPEQHRWDEAERSKVVGATLWWVYGAVAIIVLLALAWYLLTN